MGKNKHYPNKSYDFSGYARVRGFSLMEVVIFAAIGALLVFFVASLTRNVSGLGDFINQKLQERGDLDIVFSVLATEIRSAGPASNGAYPIQSASTSSFVFFSDIDQDGIFERVRYELATSSIWKGVIEPSGNPLVYATSSEVVKEVATNVVSSTPYNFFDYFDENYSGSGSPLSLPIPISDIRLVKVSALIDLNPGKTPRPTYFSQTVTIRNLRSN